MLLKVQMRIKTSNIQEKQHHKDLNINAANKYAINTSWAIY